VNSTLDTENMVYVTYSENASQIDCCEASAATEAERYMVRWPEVPNVLPDDELLAAPEALAIGRWLSERGLDDCFALFRGGRPVSARQLLSMLRTAARIADDPLIGVHVGLGLHPTSYGIVGLALLSSASLRHALRIVGEFGALLSLKVRIDLEHSGSEARLVLQDCFDLSPGLLQLCSQLEVAKLCTLLRDLAGCRINRVEIAGSPELHPQLQAAFGVPVLCERATSHVAFDSALLDMPLPQADATTHEHSLRACTDLISTLRRCDEIRRRVRQMVLSAKGAVPRLSEVAGQLFLSTRTLRRRLGDAQTSYQVIVGETRRDLAVGYLTRTTLSTEAIAEILGYSDTANFRQAFKRWTGESPQQYRRMARSGDTAGRFWEGSCTHRTMSEGPHRTRASALRLNEHSLGQVSAC